MEKPNLVIEEKDWSLLMEALDHITPDLQKIEREYKQRMPDMLTEIFGKGLTKDLEKNHSQWQAEGRERYERITILKGKLMQVKQHVLGKDILDALNLTTEGNGGTDVK